MTGKSFSYKCIETKMKGGAKIIRKVTIKGKKGYKSVTTKKKNKKAKTVRKSLNPKQVEMVKKGKFIRGLFNDCKNSKTKKNRKH